MNKDIVKFDAPELQAIEKSKAEQIKVTFEPMAKMLTEFEEAYNSVIAEAKTGITKDVTAKAKRLRLDIGKVRAQTEKVRKDQKEEYLRAGKAIDGVSNILKWAIHDKETELKEIEQHFEMLEKIRIEELQEERAEKLAPYVEDAHERNLSGMDEDVWLAYFGSKKKEHEDKLAAEKKAEEARLEAVRIHNLNSERRELMFPYHNFLSDAEKRTNFGEISKEEFKALVAKCKKAKSDYEVEQKRIQKENEALRKEAEEREKLARVDAEKRAKEEAELKAKEEAARVAREAKERKERQAHEAELRAKQEEQDLIKREELVKREKLEAELKAKEEAEEKRKQEKEAQLQAELNKGDAAKVKDLIADLEAIKTKYSFKSAKNKKIYNDVGLLVDKVINHIDK